MPHARTQDTRHTTQDEKQETGTEDVRCAGVHGFRSPALQIS